MFLRKWQQQVQGVVVVNATWGKHLGDVGVDTQLSKVDSETVGAQFLILMMAMSSISQWWKAGHGQGSGLASSWAFSTSSFWLLAVYKILQSDQKLEERSPSLGRGSHGDWDDTRWPLTLLRRVLNCSNKTACPCWRTASTAVNSLPEREVWR